MRHYKNKDNKIYKKFLTLLLLLVFYTVQTTWATNMVTFNQESRGRYDDNNQTIELKKTKKDFMYKKDKAFNEVNIIVAKGDSKKLLVDNDGNVKKIVKTSQKSDISKFITKEQNELFQDYINEAPKIITKESIPKFNVELQNGKYGYEKIYLRDGDYAITSRNREGYNNHYIAEYHKDGMLMGFAKKNYIEASRSNVTKVYYEYRIGYATNEGAGLKHILFLIVTNDKVAQYIYSANGTLMCAQVNNDIYIAEGVRNLLPDLSKKETYKPLENSNDNTNGNLFTEYVDYAVNSDAIKKNPLNIIGPITLASLFAVLAPIGAVNNKIGNLVEKEYKEKNSIGL